MPTMDSGVPSEYARSERLGERDQRPVRVAQLLADVRPYRIAFYERLARRTDVRVVLYAGYPKPGHGAPDARPDVGVPVVDVQNWFYPRRHPPKVLWHSGALRMLRSDAEVIVCNELVTNLSVWMIRLLHRRAGKRLVLMGFFYRPEGTGLSALARDALRRFLRRSASAFVAYTDQGRDELVSEGVAGDSVFVTWNTLDTKKLREIAEEVRPRAAAVRHRLEIPHDASVLAFVGRLHANKRVEVAIEAVRLLESRLDEPVVLMVIGDGEERENLEARALGAPVRFVGQTYDDRELAELLSVASLLIMPGSVGLTCVLGFSNGLPLVTTDANATMQTPEFTYVRNGENAVVVDRPEPDSYAAVVEDLLTDRGQMARLSAGAVETAAALSMERMVDAYVAATQHRPPPETSAWRGTRSSS